MEVAKTRKAHRKRNKIFFMMTVPAVILYTIFFIYPVLSGIYYSMTNWDGISLEYKFNGLENFISLFQDSRFKNAVWFSLKYTVILTIAGNILALFIAHVLNSKIRCRGFFRGIFFFPAVLSMITVGLIFDEIYYRVLPMFGDALHITALQSNILANADLAIYGILFVHLWQGIALPTVLYLAGLQGIPSDLIEAARLDGANVWQRFKNITIPFIIPVMNVALVMLVKAGLTVFDYIRAMTDGGPGWATESIGLLIYNHAFQEMKFSYSIAESLVLFVMIALVSAIQFKILSKKEVGQQ